MLLTAALQFFLESSNLLCTATLSALPAQVLDRPEFTKCMLEKLVWICAFMLVGARHGGCTVGEVEAQVRPGRVGMWCRVLGRCGACIRQAGKAQACGQELQHGACQAY